MRVIEGEVVVVEVDAEGAKPHGDSNLNIFNVLLLYNLLCTILLLFLLWSTVICARRKVSGMQFMVIGIMAEMSSESLPEQCTVCYDVN